MNLAELLAQYVDPWVATGVAAVFAILVALFGHAILVPVLRRLTRFSVLLSTLLDRIIRPGQAVLVLVTLQLIWGAAPDDLPFLATVARFTALMLIGALTWLAMRAVGGIAEAVVHLHPANVSDNLEARRVQTQTHVFARTVMFFVLIVGCGMGLMTFPGVRQIGASLLASAGIAGLVSGIAARPVLGNLIAGLQIALTQPIRLDDVVIIEGEWGRIEEITATYVVVKIWDERRLVVPLQWVIEHPFQNWTRREAQLLGTVFLWLDYRVPLAPLRAELERVCDSAPEWDGRVALLQVVETSEHAMQVRALVSSADASKGWDLRCRVREALIDFLQCQVPDGLPRLRAEIEDAEKRPMAHKPAPPPMHPGRGDTTSIRRPEHPGMHAPAPPEV
ncbi:MAG TPA: mechanosensitive ion channel family protein [Burkholderiales bacterium]